MVYHADPLSHWEVQDYLFGWAKQLDCWKGLVIACVSICSCAESNTLNCMCYATTGMYVYHHKYA